MTDQQLLKAGERLYKSFLSSQFTFLELAGLAAAREQRTPWEQLGQHLKIAVFRLVVDSQPEESAAAPQDPKPRPSVVAVSDGAPPDDADSTRPVTRTTTAVAAITEKVPTEAPEVAANPSATSGEPQTPTEPDPADSGEEIDVDRGGGV